MNGLALLALLALVLWPLASVEAGDAGASALQRAKALALRPLPALPAPEPPREVWVSERRVWVSGLGVYAIVPGHWERRISDTQSLVPSLTIFREADRAPLILPAGERPPAEARSGP